MIHFIFHLLIAIKFLTSFISSGIFQKILKTSKLIPIHKKDSKLNYSNYRSFSILSNIDKILERIMQNRLYTFPGKNELIYSFQFGFRQKDSTTHALIPLTEVIRKQLDDVKFVVFSLTFRRLLILWIMTYF